jgi:hypothetical protein
MSRCDVFNLILTYDTLCGTPVVINIKVLLILVYFIKIYRYYESRETLKLCSIKAMLAETQDDNK